MGFAKSNYPIESSASVRRPGKPGNETRTEKAKPVQVRKPKKKMSCPHCALLDQNVDANMLRLHICTHYKNFWKGKITGRLRKDSNQELVRKCAMCNRAISGGTQDGLHQAAICHFAIQHLELRQALENDKTLRDGFVTELFQDIGKVESGKKSGRAFYESLTKAVKTCHPGQRKVGVSKGMKCATKSRSEVPREPQQTSTPIRPLKRSATSTPDMEASIAKKKRQADIMAEAQAIESLIENDYINQRAEMFKRAAAAKRKEE